ncbi:hypothetical protein DFH08DRAFT_1080145 [Mycena albidolilacea]|uniref:Uncharacterized protein n=1 Tax=Mycena albidolilacea TaxID=1033008 RepID=A0AAD7ERZ3_9AGAR|nr:hypothetical protein DFH08DRAFT_1080145 [Mycena albidolilacea]
MLDGHYRRVACTLIHRKAPPSLFYTCSHSYSPVPELPRPRAAAFVDAPEVVVLVGGVQDACTRTTSQRVQARVACARGHAHLAALVLSGLRVDTSWARGPREIKGDMKTCGIGGGSSLLSLLPFIDHAAGCGRSRRPKKSLEQRALPPRPSLPRFAALDAFHAQILAPYMVGRVVFCLGSCMHRVDPGTIGQYGRRARAYSVPSAIESRMYRIGSRRVRRLQDLTIGFCPVDLLRGTWSEWGLDQGDKRKIYGDADQMRTR